MGKGELKAIHFFLHMMLCSFRWPPDQLSCCCSSRCSHSCLCDAIGPQYGSVYDDSFYAEAMRSDGSVILASDPEGLAGDTSFTWNATKFDFNGT